MDCRWCFLQQSSKIALAVLLVSLSACIGARPGPATLHRADALVDTAVDSPIDANSFDLAHYRRILTVASHRVTPKRVASHQGPTTIGYSTGGLPIESYTIGDGPLRIAFLGGIHGGTEWNTVLLAYTAIDYFGRHPERLPPAVTLQIIPAANPDGLRRVTGRWGRFQPADVDRTASDGRFNGNGVDLNRNWDCAWAATAWWGSTPTSGGDAPFSERETRVLRDFFLGEKWGLAPVQGVVFWHSAVPGVFAGGCEGIYPAAERLATIYARAAGYPSGDAFSFYPITGDATNWLSRQQIPAITVELRTRDEAEWPQNLAGMLAALDYLAGRDLVPVGDEAGVVTPVRGFSR